MHNQKIDPTKPIVISEPKQNPAFNATRHGCCSTDLLIMKGETMEQYNALEAVWLKSYNPKDEAELHLLQEMVNADWFLQRTNRKVAELEAYLFEGGETPIALNDDHHRALARFLRYQTTRRNQLRHAKRELEDYRKCRRAEKESEEKSVIKQERHAIHKQKHKPEPTWDETIDLMRKKALALGFAKSVPPKL